MSVGLDGGRWAAIRSRHVGGSGVPSYSSSAGGSQDARHEPKIRPPQPGKALPKRPQQDFRPPPALAASPAIRAPLYSPRTARCARGRSGWHGATESDAAWAFRVPSHRRLGDGVTLIRSTVAISPSPIWQLGRSAHRPSSCLGETREPPARAAMTRPVAHSPKHDDSGCDGAWVLYKRSFHIAVLASRSAAVRPNLLLSLRLVIRETQRQPPPASDLAGFIARQRARLAGFCATLRLGSGHQCFKGPPSPALQWRQCQRPHAEPVTATSSEIGAAYTLQTRSHRWLRSRHPPALRFGGFCPRVCAA